jgi:hypothetical protein
MSPNCKTNLPLHEKTPMQIMHVADFCHLLVKIIIKLPRRTLSLRRFSSTFGSPASTINSNSIGTRVRLFTSIILKIEIDVVQARVDLSMCHCYLQALSVSTTTNPRQMIIKCVLNECIFKIEAKLCF